MIPGIYGAATALHAATTNHELVAENLAHATTPGYRRHGLIFETLQQAANGAGSVFHGMRPASQFTSFEPGPLQQTGNPLDLAVTGNGFFVLDGPDGPLYTRNGAFQLNAQGELQSAGGLPVRGQGGKLTIPQGATRVTVSRDGTVYADNAAVGQLAIAQFAEPGKVLQRAGTTLFSGPAQPGEAAAGSFGVEQGYREGSNVQVVNEMVSMITGMRHYEAAEKALRALGDAVSMNTRPQ